MPNAIPLFLPCRLAATRQLKSCFHKNLSTRVLFHNAESKPKGGPDLLAQLRFCKRALGLMKTRILQGALEWVPECGWSTEALARACEKEGFSPQMHGIFGRGAVELVEFFNGQCNAKHQQLLQQMAPDLDGLAVEDRLHLAFKSRLELILPFIQQWPQAMALQLEPSNFCSTLAKSTTLVDDIYYAIAVDASVSVTRHAERAGLTLIYGATEVFLVQDTSPEYQMTWDFLKRRLREGRQLKGLVHRSGM